MGPVEGNLTSNERDFLCKKEALWLAFESEVKPVSLLLTLLLLAPSTGYFIGVER